MIVAAVLSGFAAALAAPALVRRVRPLSGYLLAVLPAGLAIYFARLLFVTPPGGGLTSFAWAPSLNLAFSLNADGLGLFFAVLISGIGAVVVVYSGGYLAGHPQLGRFYGWLLTFMGAMLGVALSDNLLLLYVFWELTSVSSYMLIGFDHEEPAARAAALQALLVTVLGGVALLAGAIMLGIAGGSMEISVLLTRRGILQASPLFLPALILVLLGAFTKSAQFPFHFWLPNAMAAPAPVSTYLHSAAMVKAGIYLLARLSPALGGNDAWTYIVGTVGMVTLLLGGYMALSRTDLKQLLAYSTVSALGLLTFLIGLGTPRALEAAIVFLLAHALYKGTLFLVAGAIDHETGTRDIRQLGALAEAMPKTAAAAALAALSMGGVLPLFGGIAKEMVYEVGLNSGPWIAAAVVAGGVFFFFIAASAAFGPFWLRVREEDPPAAPAAVHEAPLSMAFSMLALSAGSIILGIFPQWIAAPFAGPAVASAAARPVALQLSLWHGLNAAFILSVFTILLGIALYAARGYVRAIVGKTTVPWGPDAAYASLLRILMFSASAITRFLQSGHLRYYLITIIITLVGLAGIPLIVHGGMHWPAKSFEWRPAEIGFAVIIVLATIMAVRSRSLLGSVAALGAVGYSVAMIYLTFGAPDLAMTQFLIETLTVILFVLVFYRLPHFKDVGSRRSRGISALVALLGGGLITTLVIMAVGIQLHHPISGYFMDVAVSAAHGRNLVNIILVDFRGLDTLGEATVLGIAAVGVYAVIKFKKGQP
jgi:multicomponent Na+:H+ antiporter subunit A